MKRWLRRALRITTSPSHVICPEHVKTIRVDAEGHSRVMVRQTFVFLEVPEPGDVHDTCLVDPEIALDVFALDSPDGQEIGRRRRGRDTIVVDWEPRQRIIPYALYEHQHSWWPGGPKGQPALCTEFCCETRTGTFVLEIVAEGAFDAAVAFERPRWPPLRTERSLVKYALKQLEAGAERPAIVRNGSLVEWKIPGPKMGTRYICVAFHEHGVALWQDTLRKSSIAGRMRQWFGRLAPT